MQIGWVNSWFEQCKVDPWWCYSKLLNFYVPLWNTYTVWVEDTCANACRNHHAMLYCTASDIRPFKHSFEFHLVCVMQFSLLELVDVVKLFDFIVWFSNECVSPKLKIIWFPPKCHASWCKKQYNVMFYQGATLCIRFFKISTVDDCKITDWLTNKKKYPGQQNLECGALLPLVWNMNFKKKPDRSPAASLLMHWTIAMSLTHL